MARREYLTAEERTRFDTPPQLSSQQRLILIEMPPWADAYLTSLQTATNKVGFALQLGYFRQGRLCGGLPLLRGRSVSDNRGGLRNGVASGRP